MTALQLRRGVEILTSYYPDNVQMPTSCEHDKLYLGGEDLNVSREHANELRDLHFHYTSLGWGAYL